MEDPKQLFERLAYLVQLPKPEATLGETLFVQDRDDIFPEEVLKEGKFKVSDFIIRRKRQTFRWLSSVKGVLFTVNTYMAFADDVSNEELGC
jgi:Protein of unknown function (DUF3445)